MTDRQAGVGGTWFVSLLTGIEGEVQRLAGRVKELDERYASPPPELEQGVGVCNAKVERHLKSMGVIGK